MDEHPGSKRIPITINKYLYGNADPVNVIDPSGNMGLSETSVASNAMGNLATIATQTMNIYNRASTAIDLMRFAFDMKGLLDIVNLDPYTGSGTYKGTHKIDLAEAVDEFAWNAPVAIGVAAPDWGPQMAKPDYKVSSFVVLMPVFNSVRKSSISIPTRIRVRFKGKRIPVVLRFGNAEGLLGGFLGIGVQDKKIRFMYRMDHHPPEDDHGGKDDFKQDKEIYYWVNRNYHHHVMKFNQ